MIEHSPDSEHDLLRHEHDQSADKPVGEISMSRMLHRHIMSTDSLWTLLRFLGFVGLPLAFSVLIAAGTPRGFMTLPQSRNSATIVDPDLLHLQQVRQSLFLLPILGGVIVFAGSQFIRSPLHHPQMMHWLGIHGWDGDQNCLPHRRIIPAVEIICMVGLTLTCGWFAPDGLVLIPWAWLLSRMLLSDRVRFVKAKESCQQPCSNLSTILGWFLPGLVLWTIPLPWLAVPVLLIAIAIHYQLCLEQLRRLSDNLLTIELPATGPETFSFMNTKSSTGRLFPFSQLSPGGDEPTRTWHQTIIPATMTAWILFSLGTFVFSHLAIWNTDLRAQEAMNSFAVTLTLVMPLVCGTLRCIRCCLYWKPRLGPVSRLLMRRPIVWSYDRGLLPMACGVLIGCAALALPEISMAARIALSGFGSIILAFHGPPSQQEWQLTSDASLSTRFLTEQRNAAR